MTAAVRLVVVAHDRPDLYAALSRTFTGDPMTAVILDRRGEAHRPQVGTPSLEPGDRDRRVRRDLAAELQSYGWAPVSRGPASTDIHVAQPQEFSRWLTGSTLALAWSIDERADILDVNGDLAALLGYAMTEMVGRPLYDFIGEASRSVAARDVARLAGGGRGQHEVSLRRRDGSKCEAIVSAIPMVDGGDRCLGVLGLVTDLTDRRQAERVEAELAVRRAITALATSAAHHINNPLTVVVGALELVNRRADLETALRAHVQRALKAVKTIHAVIRRLGRIRRLELVDQSSALPPMLDLERSSPDDPEPPSAVGEPPWR